MTVNEALAILDKALLQKRLESDSGDVLQRLTTTKVELQGEVRVTAPEFIGAQHHRTTLNATAVRTPISDHRISRICSD
jgi:hypothetical protein